MGLLGLFLSANAWAGLTDPSLHWKTIDTGHFSIHYYEGEEKVAQRLVPIAESVYRDLSKKFDARPSRTEVVLVDDHDEANGFTLAIPYNLIILRVVPATAGSSLADFDNWLHDIFAHEFTHVIHITDTRYPAKALKFLFGSLVSPNGASPGWVTEGIATYFETVETSRGRGRASFTDMLIRTDILNQDFLHIDQMAGNQYEWPGWMAQYLYGEAFWRYLSDTYGEDKILEFSHKYGASLWLFALNNKAKRVFKDEKGHGKSFYRLWKDWKSDLEQRYSDVKARVEKEGLRAGEEYLKPSRDESYSLPTFSPDGRYLTYVSRSLHHPTRLILRDLDSGKERVLLKKKDADQIGQVSFSPDGQHLITSKIGTHKRYYQYHDLQEVDLETGKMTPLTKGKRARDPDVLPSTSGKKEKIVAVLQKTGDAVLGIYDREKDSWTELFPSEQLDHPRWLPDGKSVVVSAHRKGQRDLWIVDTTTGHGRPLTSDVAIEAQPTVDRKHGLIYYSSDRTGISNIYRYDLKSGKTSQVTNLLTGAFAPAINPINTQEGVVFQSYTGKGFEIRQVGGNKEAAGGALSPSLSTPPVERPVFPAPSPDSLSAAKNYHPFRRLFIPRYILPNIALIDGSLFVSAATGNFDPLSRHQWFGDVTYRSDNSFVGFDAGYTYDRYRVPLSLGFSDYSVNYGDVSRSGFDFFEERRRGFAGVSVPVGMHRFSLSYFLENRSRQSGLLAAGFVPTLGNYAGVYAQYAVGKTGGTAARISPESGGGLKVNFEMTHRALGASQNLEQQVVWGDTRAYLRVPWTRHHVLALRGAGGVAFGDQLLQGNFGLGGSLGESPFSASSTRLFTLRGLPLVSFSRDRAWVASAEYRMPLFRVQRGLGTFPIFLNSAHFALFADVGDAFNRGNPSFRPLLGVGGELRGDFYLGYHLPVMGRLGYGVIVTNRNRITGLQDPLTGADARNGTLVLELGTSF